MPQRVYFILALLMLVVMGSVNTAWSQATSDSDLQIRIIRASDIHPDLERDCLDALREHGPTLVTRLWPFAHQRPRVDVHLMTSNGFRDTLRGRIADWGVGAALGRSAWIDCERVPGVGRTVPYVMLHEIVHCLLHQGMGNVRVPSWFHEGVAQSFSGEWRFRDTISLMMDGFVPDLQGLEGSFPGNAQWADRAYRVSLLAVDTLIDWYGEDVIAEIIMATRLRGDFEAGFAAATDTSYDDFTARFAQSMRIRFGWLVTLTRWPTLFVLMALLFAFGAIMRIRCTRRQLAELVDPEEMDADYPGDDYPPEHESIH
ncbi:hypothetical protein H8E07_05830 [bacterium]|nr:hypothetical protein [bacterium]